MTVACKNEKCYYYDRGFCSNEVTAIDKNGMCEAVWFKGQPKPPIKEGKRMPIHILNIVKREKEFNEDEYVVSKEEIEEKEPNGAEYSGFTQDNENGDSGPIGDMGFSEQGESFSDEDSGESTEDFGDDEESESGDSEDEGDDGGDEGDD